MNHIVLVFTGQRSLGKQLQSPLIKKWKPKFYIKFKLHENLAYTSIFFGRR